jgi:teichuronic acid biosynthesis glycosyltransferase TuaC
MNVLVVTNMYPADDKPWFGSFVKEQVDALRKLGIGIEVLFFDGRRDSFNYVRAASAVRRRARNGDFDLIHAHYGLSGAVALAQRRLPVVTTFWGSDTGFVRWQAYVSRVVARRTVPVFVSQANASELGIRDATVVPSAVDVDLFHPMPRDFARAELGWDSESPHVLFPGSRKNFRKRPDLFDEAVETARQDVPELRPVALDGFSRAETALVMNAVDAMLMTSDWEGSPLAVKEALACKTPIVSVPVGDVPETIAGLPGCEVVSREPAALANALARALEAGRPEALRRRALERFSSTSVARQIAGVYEAAARSG